jgi:hypothetical protein
MAVTTTYDNKDPHPLDYFATLNRMEPGISPMDSLLSLTSLAISAKRSADALEGLRVDIQQGLADIRYAINSHGTTISSNSAASSLDTKLERIAFALENMQPPK